MSGGSKMYFEMSCPHCGIPSINHVAMNKVQLNSKGKVSQKVKCVVCGRFLKKQP